MGITQIIKRNGEIIKLNTKEPFCVVKQATQNSSLMGDDNITLQIVSSEMLSFSKGDKIVVDGFDYTIRTTTTREIQGEDYNIFEPVFYGPMYDLMKTIYRNCDKDGKSDRSTFDLTYTIKEFVQVLIYNLNRDYPGMWAFDELNCPETEAITIQFSGVNCLQVLQTLCNKDNFNLEFLISQNGNVRTIHIGKFGQRVNPPGGAEYFEWGKGNGLYKLKEQKVDDKAVITRLWVEGGTTNIRTNYREYAERLQLPYPRRYNRKRHVLSDGTVIEPNTELIGITNDNDRFLEDVALRDKIGSEEDCKTYDKIFPTRTGRVTALVAGDINAFIDDTMDFDLCKKDDKGTVYLVNEVSAKITFTSGRLAGQQFELEAKNGYDHTTKKFRLIPFTDNRGLTTPTVPFEQGGAYPIEVGATYKITDIFLPESYEENAEEDLWYAAMDDFKQATQAKAQYSLTLDRLYFLEALERGVDVCLFKVGDYAPVRDTRFGIEKQIRIQKITRNLLLEQDYQLTLSDTTAISISTQTVLSVIDHERIINNNRLRDLNKARRGWRTTEDLRNMVYDTDGFFDVDNIRPNSIDTNMLTVGSKSQQFVLTGVILQANVNGNPNNFAASAGILSHLTIDPSRIRAWQMGALTFELPSNAGYYLFAKCSKTGESGTWIMTQTQYKFEPTDDPNNYYFLVGVLSTLYADDNFRDFTTTYGFTRINGNTITTGRIITSDGECYLDLDGNKFRIGDRSSSIDWNVSRNNTITLKNVSVISESGDVAPLGVYRGVWNVNYTYYKNDEVSYTDEKGAIATCRYIHNTPTKGHKPTESVYWGVVAKGIDGKNGDFTEYRYAVSGGKLSHGKAFTASDRNPGSDWTTVMPSVGSLQYLWLTTAKINGETNALRANWTTPIRVTPYDGVDGTPGKDGDVGPALVFRGIYSSSKSYVGSDKRVDVVKYNNHYYVARTDAGTFYNVLPTNTAKWNDFGAEFETIATGFLFAENANIANLIFRNERLESQSQTNGVPNFFLDGLKNIASFGAGSAVFDGASAKLGWLNIVGRELLGFDDDGIQRLRLTPSSLPSVGGASSHEDVIIKATGGDATYTGTTNWEVSFEEDVWCYYGRDDHEDDMHDSLYAYIEFDIAEDNTLLDLSSIQFSCGVKRTNSTQYEWLDCSLSATAFLKVGTQWQTIGSVSLKDSSTAKITIPKKGRIKVSFNGTIDQTLYTDYSGKFTFATQAIWAITAKTEMIIAKDGFMAIYNANYLRMHSTDGLAVKIGNYHFRVTSSDISVSKNGTSWTKLIT